jgi:4-hydroxybenzoate polyprenyltransferase
LLALTGFSLVVASIYVVNQIADIESDRINHKLFLLPRGLVNVPTAWVLAVVCAAGGMAMGAVLGQGFVALFVVSVVLGILYNLPPAKLKNRATGGVFANAIGHGMLTYLVGWYAAKCGATVQDWPFWRGGLVSSLAPAFANGAVFLATTIPDAPGDRDTGKETFCVRYGERASAVTAFLLCAGAFASSFWMQHNMWVMCVPSGLSLPLFAWLAFAPRREAAFQTFRWPVMLLSLTVVVVVPVYGLLMAATFLVSRAYYRLRFSIEYPSFKPK